MNHPSAKSQPKSQPVKRGSFAINLIANVGQLGLNIVVAAWYVPYLVKHLGPAVYGMIPLASTITSYMALITLGLNSAVGRSMTLALEQGDDPKANQVFNTSFWGSVALTIALLIPAGLGLYFLESIVRIPAGFEVDARLLFLGTILAFLLNELKTPFDVSSFCRNRFDLRNFVGMSEVLTRVGMVVALFYFLGPNIVHVGTGILCGTVVSSIGAVILWRLLTPTLSINLRMFDWSILRQLTSTGGWVVVNHIGAILYMSIDLLVANRLLGAEATGRYAAIGQISVLIRTLGSTVAAVFNPTVLYYYARKDFDGLLLYLRRAVKCVGLMTALPIGLACGFSEPLLSLWLGKDFAELGLLLIVMTGHLSINVAILPLLGVQLATNRVRVPGLLTLVMGGFNLGLALLLAGPVNWGLYGIAAAGAIMLSLKNVLFTPIYAAHVLGKPYLSFYREIALVAVNTSLVIVFCRLVSSLVTISSWLQLGMTAAACGLVYAVAAYGVVLSAEERQLIKKMIPGKK
jgi:membrane protein EpsK